MRSLVVVVIGPSLEMGVTLGRIGPVFGIGPFSERGLDEAFCLAVGLRRVGFGAVVADSELTTGMPELVGAVAAAVVGEQSAHREAVAGEELARILEKADGSFGFLIGEQLRKGQPGVIVHGHMQGQQAGMLALAAQPTVAAQRDFAEAGHTLDVQVEQISRMGVLVTDYCRAGMEIAPAA